MVILWFLMAVLGLISFNNNELDSSRHIVPARPEPSDSEVGFGHSNAQTALIHTVFLPLISLQREQPPFGVQIYFNMTDNHPGLLSMVDLQTVWVRRPIVWSQIEPVNTTPENYNWGIWDTQFLTASANGLKVVATIESNPSWAAEYAGGPVYSEHLSSFLEFVGALVERYDGDGYQDASGSPVVNHWEFYNEPDNANLFYAEVGWGYWGNRGAEYADFLAEVYPVVKAANSSASVLMGGIAHDYFSDQGGPFDRDFVDDFLAAGGGNYIDFFNFHYYPVFAPNWEAYGHDVIGKTNFLRAKLATYGLADKPVAITEIGLSSDPNDGNGGTPEEQSRYVLRAFSRAIAANVKIMTWFTLNDLSPQYVTGVTDVDFNPKPSYQVYQTMTTQLADVIYQRALTSSELGSPQAEGYVYQRGQETVYVVWTNDDSPAQMTIQASSVAQISKSGTSTTILDVADGLADGVVTVNYDGSPVYLILAP